MTPARLTLLLILLALLVPAPAARASGLSAEILDTGGERVRAVRVADMTGDGKLEVVAFTEGPTGPGVHVYLLTGTRTGPRSADVVFRPGDRGLRSIYHLGLAVLGTGEGTSIVVTDRSRGVVALRLSAPGEDEEPILEFGPERRLANAPALPFFPDGRRPTILDVGVDLDGDGVDELLVPDPGGYRILRPGREEESELLVTGAIRRLSRPPHGLFSSRWRIPLLTKMDWDGDGIPDLAAGREGEFLLFLQRADGSFLRATRELGVLRAPDPDGDRFIPVLEDVDGDGRADLLLSQCPASVGVFDEFASRQTLYLNPQIFSLEAPGRLATPRAVVATPGISLTPKLVDFDGDGDLDLLVTSLDLTVKSHVRRRVIAEYRLFLFDSERRSFEDSPFFSVSRPYPMKLLDTGAGAAACFFTGDFDGDGDPDLVDTGDEGHVTVLKGTRDTGLLSTARYDFKREIFRTTASLVGDPVIRDLDGDGIADLVGHTGDHVFLLRSVP